MRSNAQSRKETHVWQHTVPESYLKRFTNADGLLYVYDKSTGKMRRDKPSNVAAAKQFYTYPCDVFRDEVPDEDERKAVEHFFAQEIEPSSRQLSRMRYVSRTRPSFRKNSRSR